MVKSFLMKSKQTKTKHRVSCQIKSLVTSSMKTILKIKNTLTFILQPHTDTQHTHDYINTHVCTRRHFHSGQVPAVSDSHTSS